MKRIIAPIAAAGMLVAGAFVATSITSTPADAQEVTATASSSDVTSMREAVLDEVLDGLVSDGTITQAQADDVKAAFVDKYAELEEEREARRAERQETRELIQGFLEDDVIDADELAQLPDDFPWFDDDSVLADALEDGELTKEELQEALPGHVHRHRHPMRGQGMDADSSAEESVANA